MPPAAPSSKTAPLGQAVGTAWNSALRLIRFAISVDPRAFFLTAAVSLVGSLAEGATLVLLLPLLAAAGMTFTGPTIPGRLASTSQLVLTRLNIPHALWLPAVLALFLLVGAIRSLLRRSQYMLAYTTTTTVELALSRRVYAAVVKAQWGYLVRQRSGRLTHLLTQELRHVTDAISLSLSLINLACMTALYLAFALKLSTPITLLVLALGAGIMLLQRNSLGRTRASGQALAESVGEVYAATEEHLLNIKSTKTCDAEDADIEMFAALTRQVARDSVRTARHQAAAAFRFELGSLIALGAIVFLALAALHVQPATMLLLLAIFTRLMPQLASLQSQVHQYAGILPSFEHVLRIEADCRFHAEAIPTDSTRVSPLTLVEEFRLEEVWFAYRPVRRTWYPEVIPPNARLADPSEATPPPAYVLKNITLPIQAGLLTAITGPSGSGKSTLADIVNGLLTANHGSLLLDGRSLTPAETRQWRRQVGYVGQETVLFHQSVRQNLLWAQPHATEPDLTRALTLAEATFVYDLPGGLDSIVGDRGILLSSGQRQRLSLARALLRQPTLLILDEATNALDTDNEARILDTIHALLADPAHPLTVLMIAHRPSALARAHRTFTLDAGHLTGAP